jgi:diacylglycerol kinase family enzyme
VNVDVILNRRARGLGEHSRIRAVLLRAAAGRGALTHETHSLDELDRVAQALAARGTDAVVLAGGDGSHMGGLSALARAFRGALPPVALAPGGTVGTVARNLGMHEKAAVWAEKVVHAACTGGGRLEEHPTLRVTDDAGGDRVGFIFGAGLVARFFDEYYGAASQGLLPAAGIAARVFAGSLFGSALAHRVLAPAACSLTVDGEAQGAPAWSLVLASVVPDVGLHVRATYRAREKRGTFHVVASGLSPRGLAFEVPRVLTGRAMHGEPRVDTVATSLHAAFDETAAYVLDGDLIRARDVHVTPGPVLRLIVP